MGSLALGMAGQVIYHLLSAAHATRAPWPVVVLVSCLSVVTLGFGAALTHLLHGTVAEDVPDGVPIPALDDTAGTVPAVTADLVPIPEPEVATGTVARRARRRPADHTRRAERRYAADLADGQVPSLRGVMRDLNIGQDRAREVRAHLASVVSAEGGETA